MLAQVQNRDDGWRSVVEGRDPDDISTANEIGVLKQKATLLCQSYRFALQHMGGPEPVSFLKCCNMAKK